ncbi:serine carboxypeptidase-like 50 [Benincasa hispida]|uniref:serine carboxypeptidase-like 50 n=1 Tax=Benincasa hispida TaxID=102211 RepID=UPI0018FF8E1E|nr:serine carboxypeptidase-like 50 [Benincasa hispida]XP_038893259.1 serine carboxypeptidase-like 50 [Benincasa hispida]
MNSINFLLSVFFFFFFFFFASFPFPSTSSPPLFPPEALPTKSGYLPINPTTGSAIFFTFYEAQTPISSLTKTPLLIWLQGGPGCSSMVGNFFELGPWRVNFHKQKTEPISLIPNPGSWNRRFGVLFLDNPIGTGFSIAATQDEIPRNQYSVSKHLFTAISSFIELDLVFKNRPIYITGESYAGKYVPSIGYYILKKNPKLPYDKRVNLVGVAIGDGLTDPITQVTTHGLNAFYSGLINEKQKKEMEIAQMKAVELIKMGKWNEATNARLKVLDLLKDMTGLATLYDYTRKSAYNTDLVDEFLSFKEVKRALGVKNESMVFEGCSDVVGEVLKDDVMKSVRYKVDFLVKNSKVLLYQGQYDLRDGVVSTEAWVNKLKWDEIENFLGVERKIWRVGDELAGYVQKWMSLSNVVVLGAGHLLPTDQALNSQAMIEDWVLEKGVFGDDNAQEKKKSFGSNGFRVW